MKKIIHIDMDDTTMSFIGDERLFSVPIEPIHQDHPPMHELLFFRNQKPLPGAIEAINKLIDSNLFEIYILSVPLYTSPHSYSEKVESIREHLPRLLNRIILTQDKSLIKGDYLIDDSLHWKDKWESEGKTFIHFNPRKDTKKQWNDIVEYFLTTYRT